MSPFRFADHPNIRNGVAMVTEAPDAVQLFDNLIASLWRRAAKGREGAERLRQVVERVDAGVRDA